SRTARGSRRRRPARPLRLRARVPRVRVEPSRRRLGVRDARAHGRDPRARAPRRSRRGHPGSRQRDPRGGRIRAGERHPVPRGTHQEPLHRTHLHPAVRRAPPSQRRAQIQRAPRRARGQARRRRRRFDRARQHERPDRRAPSPERRARGAHAHLLAADPPFVLLRGRHGTEERAHRVQALGGGDPPARRRGFAGLPVPGGHDPRERRRPRRVLRRVLHRRVPRSGAARARERRPRGAGRGADRAERDREGMTGLTYRASGVDPSRAESALSRIRARIAKSKRAEVIGDIGAFGGLFASPGADMVLVATTDGVGTKLDLARMLDRHEVVGADLVNHCVNDAMAMGAEPLFFLDYFATSHLEPDVFARVVGAMADACAAHGCALLGGETAEMPGTYGPGSYDLAGFLVGAVRREAILDPKNVRVGDVCLGFASSGLHTNGYTLARAVAARAAAAQGKDVLAVLTSPRADLDGASLGDALLRTHTSYLATFRALRDAGTAIRSIGHLTGGGW